MPPTRRDYATTMCLRAMLGGILSVLIVAGALLISMFRRPPAKPELGLAAATVPLTVYGPDSAAAASAAASGPKPMSFAGVDGSYVRAARTCPGLDPAVLAAIHTVETRMGRDHRVSDAGAVGPMQFLPSTWAHYGMDGNGDGHADITNFSDAVFSAARYLCANGGADSKRLPGALWNDNHSDAYV